MSAIMFGGIWLIGCIARSIACVRLDNEEKKKEAR